MNLTKKNKILYLVTLILVVGGDLFTKHLVSSSMLLGQSHEIIGAVSVSGPSLRFDEKSIESIYHSLKQILEEVQYVY